MFAAPWPRAPSFSIDQRNPWAHEVLAEQDSVLMVFGGEPVGPRHIFWNFVSSQPERIEQAKADWRAGRFALPPDDHDEFIPLPG